MKTIQMTIDEVLLKQVDEAAQTLGLARSVFIRQALEIALRELAIAKLEQEHIDGYRSQPVMAGEFDIWENEQEWGEG